MDIDRVAIDGMHAAKERFAERLRECRLSSALTREAIAKQAGCSGSWLKAIEQGVRDPDVNLGVCARSDHIGPRSTSNHTTIYRQFSLQISEPGDGLN